MNAEEKTLEKMIQLALADVLFEATGSTWVNLKRAEKKREFDDLVDQSNSKKLADLIIKRMGEDSRYFWKEGR